MTDEAKPEEETTPEPNAEVDPEYNWIVPFRRVVIKKKLRYRDLMWRWLRILSPHVVTRPDLPESQQEVDDLGDAEVLLAVWYDRDAEEHRADYRRAVARLRRWWHLTFLEAKIASSPVGTTTCEVGGPNFHARLWKGPKRVLLEQPPPKDKPPLDASYVPIELVDGRIETHCLEDGSLPEVLLYPGDVLELPLHVFLTEYGLSDFDDLEFDPTGSFYLGTAVRSKSGAAREEQPKLHDNLLAMRFQLVHALNMANCYHAEPVYTSDMKFGPSLKPEGAGVYARGMPFAGNPSIGNQAFGSYDPAWKVGTVNTPIPAVDRPICMPTYKSLEKFAKDLPYTWSWTCSPFAHFFFSFMADVHTTNAGLKLPGLFIQSSLAKTLLISGEGGASSEKNNVKLLEKVNQFAADSGDPLLVHQLTSGDVDTAPRTTTPLGDLCSFVFPGDRPLPERAPFKPADPDRFLALSVPATGAVDRYDWDEIAPDAGVLCISSAKGHEFCMVRLFSHSKIVSDAQRALLEGSETPPRPSAGHLAAYNPLSGEEVSLNLGKGQFYITEASAEMPPKKRELYKPLKLTEVSPHHFWTIDPAQKKKSRKKKFKKYPERPPPTDDEGNPLPAPEPAAASRIVEFAMLNHKNDKKGDDPSLRIDVGQDFRERRVSSIIYLVHGAEGSENPRHLTNVYSTPRDMWAPIWLKTAMGTQPKSVKRVLGDLDLLYGERAVPFPTILEVAEGFAVRSRVFKQLDNHRARLEFLGKTGAAQAVEAEIAAETKSKVKSRLESDLEMTDPTDTSRQELRKDLLKLVQP